MNKLTKSPLKSVKIRIFFTCWILYSAHFATNVVREHYPAFAIAEHGTFQVDEYLGFHSDIFLHHDGHAYIGNNVAGSVIAALPLFLFDPILDYLESYGRQRVLQAGDNLNTTYEIDKPNRQKFFKLVKERGLHLRFGAATVITSVFLMAPLSAWFVVFIFSILMGRGIELKRAVWLAMLFAFATPIFFRTAHLNHNMFLMMAIFCSFYLLWKSLEDTDKPASRNKYALAGFLAGCGLALDYAGIVPLLFLAGYLLIVRLKQSGVRKAFRDLAIFALATVPPVAFLFYSQWSMYGHPLYPGQYWMPEVNYTDRGWRGISWPTFDLYFLNLFSLDYGMFTFAPLLLAGFVPVFFYKQKELIFSPQERYPIAIYIFMFLTFCAANQYSRMQFNTGFRYLLPVVPFVFLLGCEHLRRFNNIALAVISVPAILNSWVLTMFRESLPVSWQLFFQEGIQLPWLRVLKLTSQFSTELIPYNFFLMVVLSLCSVVIFFTWTWKRRQFLQTKVAQL